MDEILTALATEELIEVPMSETIEVEPTIKDLEAEVEAEVTAVDFETDPIEMIEIEMDEAIGWSGGDSTSHHNLYGRDDPDQHIIESITGLREELDEIERLKTVYSDKSNIANYYKWANDNRYDTYGYFVSIVPDSTEIKLCEGPDIFGVSVNAAAFIGGQYDVVPRDSSYGLIVTSGLVDVRCELDVNVGDCVVSNAQGFAKKSDSNYGYKVLALAKDETNGETYAVIALGVQADVINSLGIKLNEVKEQADTNYKNIMSATNVANQAYNIANKIEASNRIMSEQVGGALSTVDKVVSDVGDLSTQVSNATTSATQAQAIANIASTSAQSAALSAETAKKEAIQKAQDAIDDTIELRNEFALMDDQITDIDGRVTIVTKQSNEHHTAIAGIQTTVKDESARIDNLVTWQGVANSAMARVENKADANGAYIQSTVTNMDTHSVGPHSQAYGFTLEQATSIIEDGMIYVPTVNSTEEYPRVSKPIEYPEDEADLDITNVYYVVGADDSKTETYYYWGQNVNTKEYDWLTTTDFSTIYDSRSFLRGYLYKWGILPSGLHGWITVDKFYNDTDITNTSAPSVFFTVDSVPGVVSGETWGYWYTDGDTLTGDVADYQPKTLYKWAPYKQTELDGKVVQDEEGNIIWKYDWCPVATLAGNSRTRATSQIRQDVNSISFEVTNPRGSFAGVRAELTETSASVSSLADWKSGKDSSKAIIRQEATGDETKIVIAAVTETDDEITDIASLELKVAKDENSNSISKLLLSAEDIQFTSSADYGGIRLNAGQITLDGESIVVTDSEDNTTRINGDKIATGTITAEKIAADAITAEKIAVNQLSAISANLGDITSGAIQSPNYSNESSIVVWGKELDYVLNEDEESYTVSGVGDYVAENIIVIPDIYNGLPVTNIGNRAFGDRHYITSVIIGKNITSIGDHAFYDCVNLVGMIIPNGVTTIGNQAFYGCDGITSITIPDSVVNIGQRAFSDCAGIKNVIIGNGITNIDVRVFFNCSNLESIVIPSSITNIDGYAFGGCYRLANIYYAGSKEQWTEINIGSGDIYLTRATRYYYSETKPTDEDNYWHYKDGTDGFKISCDDDYLIDSKHFKVTPDGDVTANNGELAGWIIAENGIEKKVGDKPVVGMHSGDTSYISLVDESSPSPIRFYAGAWSDDDLATPITKTLIFTSTGEQLSQTFTLDEQDSGMYKINSAKCLTAEYAHKGEGTGNYMFLGSDFKQGIYHNDLRWGCGKSISILPEWVVETNDITVTCLNTSLNASASYIGNGQVLITVSSDSKPAENIKGIVNVVASYDYAETLDVDATYDDSSVEVIFNPKTTGVEYSLEIEYTLDLKDQNFKVLEDGSLYANNAKISGTIYATDGEFHGKVYADEGEFNGKVIATDGEFTGTVHAVEGDIGKLKISEGGVAYNNSYSLNESGLVLKDASAKINAGNLSIFNGDTSSYIQADGPVKITAQNGTAIELMTDIGSNTSTSYTATLYCRFVWSTAHDTSYWDYTELQLKVDSPLKYPRGFLVPYERWSQGIFSSVPNKKKGDGTLSFTIAAQETDSNIVVIKETSYYLKFQNANGDWSSFYIGAPRDTEIPIIQIDSFTQTVSNNNIKITGHLTPSNSATDSNNDKIGEDGYNLGSEKAFWNTVFAKTGSINTSDRNNKNTIQPLSDTYGRIFDSLKPVSYKFNQNNNNRTHTGLIAQDVKEAIENTGITTQDFAGYCEWENDDGSVGCGLRYEEFIALCVDQIQKLKKRVEELENKLNITQND